MPVDKLPDQVSDLEDRLTQVERHAPSTKILRRRLFKPRTVTKDMLVFTQTDIMAEAQGSNLSLSSSYQVPANLSITIQDAGRYICIGKITVTGMNETISVSLRNQGTAFTTTTAMPGASEDLTFPILLVHATDFTPNAVFDMAVKSDNGATTGLAVLGSLQAVRIG